MLKGGGQRFDVEVNLEENEIVKTPTNTLMLSKVQGSAKLNEARTLSRAPPATESPRDFYPSTININNSEPSPTGTKHSKKSPPYKYVNMANFADVSQPTLDFRIGMLTSHRSPVSPYALLWEPGVLSSWPRGFWGRRSLQML